MRVLPRDWLRKRLRVLPRTILLALSLAILSPHLAAQDVSVRDTLEQLRTALAAANSLDEETRTSLEQRLAAIEVPLEEAASEREQQQQLRETIERGDERIADYQARMLDIEGAPQNLTRRLGTAPDLAEIEAEIGIVESQRSSWTADRSEALDAMASVATDTAAARERLAQVNALLSDALNTTPSSDATLEERIDLLAQIASRQALRAESERLQLQLRAEPAVNGIRTARVAWLDAAIDDADALLAELREAASAQRQSAARQRGAETRRLLGVLREVRPALQGLADANQSLIADQQDFAAAIEQARQSLARLRETRERIEQDANLTRRRLEVAGLEAELGEVMLSRLASLPSTPGIVTQRRARSARIADVSILAIDTEQALRERADRSAYLLEVLGERDDWSAQERRVSVQLYEQQRELLRENLQAQNTQLRLLVDANQASDELLLTLEDYGDFLTGNLLWTRNYAYASPDRLLKQLGQLSSMLALRDPINNLPAVARDPVTVALVGLLLILLTRRRRTRHRLREMLGKPISPSSESTGMLLTALALTLLKALPLPLFLAILGRALHIAGAADPTLQSISAALYAAGIALLALNILRSLSSRVGAGRRLLKWNSAKVDALTRDLHWAAPLLVVAVGVNTLGRYLTPTDSGGPLAAAGSLAEALLLLVLAWRALRTEQFIGDRFASYGLRLSALLAGAIVFMHASGQLFAAHMYLRALMASIVAVLLTLTIMSTLQRVLQLYRFRLQQRSRDELREREIESEKEGEDTSEREGESREAREEALASLTDAHRQLLSLLRLLTLGTLLWLIWSPALPALSVLDNFTLWSTTDSTLPEGELRAITLSVLLLAILTLVITALVTRHLPPLVNVFILEWSKVSAGGRYAAGMLMQYLIIGVGGSLALSLLGFEWGKVQWLVAALGVGIGFGLQEIVANFISGIIVLFERPIRVGDIIHAGGNDGVVRRINARATVVETFEGKEVMIPNKELITNVVTNWSLTSPKLRILVPIGVAYGSDVDLAMQLLVRAAQENSEVLEDPAPIVTFEDFGDNALVLWLRCYTTHDYPVIQSQLRVAIYELYEEAGLSIAFPQRDVHLDASEPIPVRMVSAPDGS